MNHLYIIANIQAGSGNGADVLNQAQDYLRKFRAPFITLTTEYKGHSIELTQQILAKAEQRTLDTIIVVGGDGTLHEVVATLKKAKQTIPIIYLAAGTGNDFKRTWSPNASVESTLQQYLMHKNITTVPIFESYNHLTKNTDVVLNSLGFGFDGTVIYEVNTMPQDAFFRQFLNGKFAYLVNVFKAVSKLDHFDVHLTVDNQTIELENCQLISLMNSPYLGGGIQLSTDIKADEKIINVVAIKNVKPINLLKLMWQILVSKTTPAAEHYFYTKGEKVTIQIEEPILSQVDGELLNKDQAHLTLTLTEYPFYL